MTQHSTPAGWHPDPSDPSQQRYWDGSAWTDHVAPAVAPRGLTDSERRKKSITLGLIGGALGMISIIGALFLLDQRSDRQADREERLADHDATMWDNRAAGDAAALGREISLYYLNEDGQLTVEQEGDDYVLRAPGFEITMWRTEGVALGGFVATDADDWCVWTTAAEGDVKDASYSAGDIREPGRC